MRSPFRAAVAALGLGLSLLAIAPGAVGAPASADKKALEHEVAEGQSLWKIAKRYNVSVDAIRAANGLPEGQPIQPGKVLRIPSKEEAKKLTDKARKEAADPPKVEAEAVVERAKVDRSKEHEKKSPWWMEKPGDETQTQKTPAERGGVNPCLSEDPGWGIYDRWNRSPSMGQMIIPARGGVTKAGRFDVVIHFHGHEPARKEFVKVMDGAVLVGITLGIGSGAYSSAFASPQAFKDLIESVEAGVAEARGIPEARVRKVGLSGWSAGYGAVEQILTQPLGKQLVDSVFLLDGLHAGYSGAGLDENQLRPFLDFAQKAKAGQKFMFVSHSSIIPPGYASTTETANWLVMKLGGKPKAKRGGAAPMGLEQNQRWDAGGFHVRGYDGNDKMDHCAHLGLLKDVLRVHLKPRWDSPKGQGPKAQAAKDKPQAAKQKSPKVSSPSDKPRGSKEKT